MPPLGASPPPPPEGGEEGFEMTISVRMSTALITRVVIAASRLARDGLLARLEYCTLRIYNLLYKMGLRFTICSDCTHMQSRFAKNV